MIEARFELNLGPLEALTRGEVGRAVRTAANYAAVPMKADVVANAQAIAKTGGMAKAQRIKVKNYQGRRVVVVIGPSTKYSRSKKKAKRGKRKGQKGKYFPGRVAHLVEKGTKRTKPRKFLEPALNAGFAPFVQRFNARLWQEVQAALARRSVPKS